MKNEVNFLDKTGREILKAIKGLNNAAIHVDAAANRVEALDSDTVLGGINVIDVTGIPEYLKSFADYTDYNLTESGWYVFVRITAKGENVVTENTTVSGAAGYIATEGNDYIDVAIRFDVAAQSQVVRIDWGSYTDVYVFKATDLAIRNLDYMARFYVYDISEFCTWTYELTADTEFVAGNRYFTLSEGVYTEAIEGTDWTAGDTIPADTYYKHSKLTLAGMTPNVTYKLDEKLDCPLEITLPEVTDDGHGAWFEIQMNYKDTYSCTLLPPEGVKIGTAQTQAQSAGINTIDLQYTDVDDIKMWTLLNTHSNIPT